VANLLGCTSLFGVGPWIDASSQGVFKQKPVKERFEECCFIKVLPRFWHEVHNPANRSWNDPTDATCLPECRGSGDPQLPVLHRALIDTSAELQRSEQAIMSNTLRLIYDGEYEDFAQVTEATALNYTEQYVKDIFMPEHDAAIALGVGYSEITKEIYSWTEYNLY
ncbi:hypothetical protein Tco_1276569, partial [Tanacetum coccineum]